MTLLSIYNKNFDGDSDKTVTVTGSGEGKGREDNSQHLTRQARLFGGVAEGQQQQQPPSLPLPLPHLLFTFFSPLPFSVPQVITLGQWTLTEDGVMG